MSILAASLHSHKYNERKFWWMKMIKKKWKHLGKTSKSSHTKFCFSCWQQQQRYINEIYLRFLSYFMCRCSRDFTSILPQYVAFNSRKIWRTKRRKHIPNIQEHTFYLFHSFLHLLPPLFLLQKLLLFLVTDLTHNLYYSWCH